MKKEIGPIPYVYPIPITLVGAVVGGKPNFATIGDVGLMGIRPPLVAVSLHERHHTTPGILECRTFSINFPTTAMLAETDYCGMVSGSEVDKAALFTLFYGKLETVPMIAECPVNLECRVVRDFAIRLRHIFIGEVVQTHVAEQVVAESGDGIADLGALDPVIYSLDNRYYRIGEAIGTGYSEGKTLADG